MGDARIVRSKLITETATTKKTPRVVVCWRMTVNGIALIPICDPICGSHLPALPISGSPENLSAALEQARLRGTPEVALQGDTDWIAAAFEQRLVDEVVCFIDPVMALSAGPAVSGGIGAATVDEGWRLADVTCGWQDGALRVQGRVVYP